MAYTKKCACHHIAQGIVKISTRKYGAKNHNAKSSIIRAQSLERNRCSISGFEWCGSRWEGPAWNTTYDVFWGPGQVLDCGKDNGCCLHAQHCGSVVLNTHCLFDRMFSSPETPHMWCFGTRTIGLCLVDAWDMLNGDPWAGCSVDYGAPIASQTQKKCVRIDTRVCTRTRSSIRCQGLPSAW